MSCLIHYESVDDYEKQVEDAKKWRELQEKVKICEKVTYDEEFFEKYEHNGGDMIMPKEIFWDFYYEYEDLVDKNYKLNVENMVLRNQIAAICPPKYDYGISMSSSEGGSNDEP